MEFNLYSTLRSRVMHKKLTSSLVAKRMLNILLKSLTRRVMSVEQRDHMLTYLKSKESLLPVAIWCDLKENFNIDA